MPTNIYKNSIGNTAKFNSLVETIRRDHAASDIANLITNKWGINLCSVESIDVTRNEFGELTDLHVKFIPGEQG